MKQFYFKNEYWGEDWQEYSEKRYGVVYDLDDVAHNVAHDHYNEEPCEPHNFEFVIEVKDSNGNQKAFNVIAEADVNFYASEVEIKKEVFPHNSHHTECHWSNCPGDCFERYGK